LDYSSLDH